MELVTRIEFKRSAATNAIVLEIRFQGADVHEINGVGICEFVESALQLNERAWAIDRVELEYVLENENELQQYVEQGLHANGHAELRAVACAADLGDAMGGLLREVRSRVFALERMQRRVLQRFNESHP